MLRPSRAAFAFILFTVALDMLALGIMIPVQGALSSVQGIAMMIAPLILAEIFSVSIQRGGRPYSGVPFAFTSLVLCTALLVAARATRLNSS